MAGEKAGQGKEERQEGTARHRAIPWSGGEKLKSHQHDRAVLTAQAHGKTSGLPAPVRVGDAVRGQAAVKCHADRQRPFRAEYGESVHLLPGKRQIPVPVLHGAHPQEPEILHGFGSGKGYPDPGFRGVGYERVIRAVLRGSASARVARTGMPFCAEEAGRKAARGMRLRLATRAAMAFSFISKACCVMDAAVAESRLSGALR